MTAIAPADHAAYLDWLRAQLDQAIIPLDDAAWEDTRNRNSISDYSAYLQRFPNPRHRPEAIQEIAAIEAIETASWEGARQANALQGYAAYLYEYPHGRYRDAAIQARDQRLREMQDEYRRNKPKADGRIGRVLRRIRHELIDRRPVHAMWCSSNVNAVAFVSNGQYALSLANGEIEMWNLNTSKMTQKWPTTRASDWLAIASGDAPRLHVLLATYDNQFALWDLETGKIIRTFCGHTGEVTCCVVSPDGRHAFTGSEDKTIRQWSLLSGDTICVFEGHSEAITTVTIHPDGRHLLSTAWNDPVHLWSIETSKIVRTFEGHGPRIQSVAVTLDGCQAFFRGASDIYQLFDLNTGQIIRSFNGYSRGRGCVAITLDGLRGFAASWGRTMWVWDLESGEELDAIRSHHLSGIRNRKINADGQFILIACRNRVMSLWPVGK